MQQPSSAPESYRSRLVLKHSAMSWARDSPAIWGVTEKQEKSIIWNFGSKCRLALSPRTFSWHHRGESDGRGSWWKTSRTAPAKCWLSKANTMSPSVIILPRPILTNPTWLQLLRTSLKRKHCLMWSSRSSRSSSLFIQSEVLQFVCRTGGWLKFFYTKEENENEKPTYWARWHKMGW